MHWSPPYLPYSVRSFSKAPIFLCIINLSLILMNILSLRYSSWYEDNTLLCILLLPGITPFLWSFEVKLLKKVGYPHSLSPIQLFTLFLKVSPLWISPPPSIEAALTKFTNDLRVAQSNFQSSVIILLYSSHYMAGVIQSSSITCVFAFQNLTSLSAPPTSLVTFYTSFADISS